MFIVLFILKLFELIVHVSAQFLGCYDNMAVQVSQNCCCTYVVLGIVVLILRVESVTKLTMAVPIVNFSHLDKFFKLLLRINVTIDDDTCLARITSSIEFLISESRNFSGMWLVV